MNVTLSFPGMAYSEHKKEIAKVRKAVGCTEWTGSSWFSDDLVIETDFQKAAIRLGIEREYDGDVLVLSGECGAFIDRAEEWGAEIEIRRETTSKYDPEDRSAEIENFQVRARAMGFSKGFIKVWSELITNGM